ncbi:MAG: 16S rRNA (adenine(1518)-N(6)/adenine(1519)-N(6))-dimethyltransferase RsmA [Candidatus Paceibacterota bacterium]|jgi:16S rRNA (adenine1518-N6/adenine1519-N6)-dimethyltransferase
MIHAKKSLGQNFLNSKTVARDIVRAASLTTGETVLEIGPGKGFLTSELLASGALVIAVEKDDRMIPLLTEKFAEQIKIKQFTLIHGDIVELTTHQTFFSKNLGGQDYKLVANIPYYLTGQIIRMFLEAKNKPTKMVLMVQKEVATRIVARDKKESILSIAVKVYGTPKFIKKVPARYFSPTPKVDSAVLSIENISNKNFKNKKEEEKFFKIVRAGFAHKRKVLAGNLKELFGDKTIEIFVAANIKDKARAENLTLKDWLNLLQIKFQ